MAAIVQCCLNWAERITLKPICSAVACLQPFGVVAIFFFIVIWTNRNANIQLFPSKRMRDSMWSRYETEKRRLNSYTNNTKPLHAIVNYYVCRYLNRDENKTPETHCKHIEHRSHNNFCVPVLVYFQLSENRPERQPLNVVPWFFRRPCSLWIEIRTLIECSSAASSPHSNWIGSKPYDISVSAFLEV